MAERPAISWRNPTLVRGAAFVVGGLAILALPQASLTVARYVVAAFLIGSGSLAYWGRLWRTRDGFGIARSMLAMATGVGLILVPAQSIHWVERILAGYLAVHAALSLFVALRHRRNHENATLHVSRSIFLLALAIVLVSLPRESFYLAVVSAAVAAIFVGLIMVAWVVRHGAQRPRVADRAIAAEVVWYWLVDRDLGDQRREAVAEGLYFEPPDREAKLVSYVSMLLLSTALASLAILQDSTAVVIGAMLVAPLMTPIMGCAAGLVAGWRDRVLRSLAVVAASVAASIGLAWVLASWIPEFVPLEVNSQVLARTSPTLVDMAVALAAGAAGAYATIDNRVSSSLTGVAIAVALVPPLGVVGITLQAGMWQSAGGAFLLFATNMVAIILASSIVFLLFGLAPGKARSRIGRDNADVAVSLAVVALLIMLPLGLTGENVLKQINQSTSAQSVVKDWLDGSSDLRLLRVRVREQHVDVHLSGSGEVPELADLQYSLSERLDDRVRVRVELFPSVILEAAAPALAVGEGER